jgi:hypothetical protein
MAPGIDSRAKTLAAIVLIAPHPDRPPQWHHPGPAGWVTLTLAEVGLTGLAAKPGRGWPYRKGSAQGAEGVDLGC